MSHRTPARHRAPRRLTTAGTTLTRSLKATAVAATSGALLAAALVPANAGPVIVVDEAAAMAEAALAGTAAVAGAAEARTTVPADEPETVINVLHATLPSLVGPADKPAKAVAAPETVERETTFGTVGFTGVVPPPPAPEPEVEPEPEPEVEPEPETEVEPEPEFEPAEEETAEAAQPAPEASSSDDWSEGSSPQEPAEETSPQEPAEETSQEQPAEEESARSSAGSSSTEGSGASSSESSASPAPAPTGGVLSVAAAYTGIMYSYGGSSPSTGFDCSGYTSYVFAQVGINLPRGAAGQQSYATPVSDPQPGDLVFWGYPAYNVGIYAGNGMVYDSGRPGLPSQLRPVFSGVSGYGRVG